MNPASVETPLLDAVIKEARGKILLELGSGVSTAKLANAGVQVYSVEHDPRWVCQHPNVHSMFCPLYQGWYKISWDELPKDIEFVLVDGPPMMSTITDPLDGRAPRFHLLRFIDKFKTDTVFFIDDVDRKLDRLLAYAIGDILDRPVNIQSSGKKQFARI